MEIQGVIDLIRVFRAGKSTFLHSLNYLGSDSGRTKIDDFELILNTLARSNPNLKKKIGHGVNQFNLFIRKALENVKEGLIVVKGAYPIKKQRKLLGKNWQKSAYRIRSSPLRVDKTT